jgi:hypothetical protein
MTDMTEIKRAFCKAAKEKGGQRDRPSHLVWQMASWKSTPPPDPGKPDQAFS